MGTGVSQHAQLVMNALAVNGVSTWVGGGTVVSLLKQ